MVDRVYEGVIWQYDGELEVTGASSPVSVAAGWAIVDGNVYNNSAALAVAITAPATFTRIDRLVLRKDSTNQTVRVHRIAGIEGGAAPAIVQIDGTTWDIKLAQISITVGGVITVTDEREFVQTPLELNKFAVQGRLTLTTNTPVMTAEALAQSTVYYTPYIGNQITLFIGGYWRTKFFTERQLSILGYDANSNYDIFIYDNGGVITLEGVKWASDTARATALVLQDGHLVKAVETNKLYLGTIRTVAAGQTEYSFITTRPPKMFVWNYYNKVKIRLQNIVPSAGWTTTSGTSRLWNNDAASIFEMVIGVSEDAITEYCGISVATTGTYDILMRYNGVTTAAVCPGAKITGSAGLLFQLKIAAPVMPRLGYNYFDMYEIATGANATTTNSQRVDAGGGSILLKG